MLTIHFIFIPQIILNLLLERKKIAKFLSCITMGAFFFLVSSSVNNFVWAVLIAQIIKPFSSGPCACSHRKLTLMAGFGTAAPKKPLNRNKGPEFLANIVRAKTMFQTFPNNPCTSLLFNVQFLIPSKSQAGKKEGKEKELQSKERGGTKSESCCVNQLNAIKIYLGFTRNPFTGE